MSMKHTPRRTSTLLAASLLACLPAVAQVSITTAVDLALKNSPRVKMAEAEVAKAQAALSQSKNVFVPSLIAGAGLGQSYGYSPNPPTLFFFNAQSLVYNTSQFDYIRSARAGLDAAGQSLQDMREAVAEDAALTFLALDHDQQREDVLRQQTEFSTRLISIVQDRFDVGRDSRIDLTSARLSAAQLHLASLRAAGETAIDRAHLAHLLGIAPATLRAAGGFPSAPALPEAAATPSGYANASVAAAFATARAKQELAWGDARYLYRPQFASVIQYNRYATFTDSFKNLQKTNGTIGANEYVFGVQISIPLFDRVRQGKARESAAEASRALHEAEYAQFTILDAQSRLTHTLDELRARAEVASLEQQLAQQQLDALLVQLTAPTGNGPQMTPKDEQNSRIAEREKYLSVVEATYQLHQTEINLLRQSGQLQQWLHTTARPTP